MKKIITILALIFFIGKNYGQWLIIPSPTTLNLNQVHFGNNNTGYIGSVSAGLLKTTNTGSNWAILNNYSTSWLYCINKDSLFIAAPTILARSNDGCNSVNSYSSTYFTQDTYYTSIFALNSKFAWACGSVQLGPGVSGSNYSRRGGFIMRTKDSGANWASYGFYGPAYKSIFFVDSLLGYVCGYDVGGYPGTPKQGYIYKTIDGGVSWSALYATGPLWTSLCFVNKNLGYVAGGNGKIWKTTDGGVTWAQQYTYVSTNFSSIHFATPDTGCVVGNGGMILGTVDGGNTWQQQYSSTSNNLNSVFFTDKNNGYIVGDNGTILKTIGSPVGIKENNKTQTEFNIYPNPVKNLLRIEHPNSEIEVSINDLSGRNTLNEKLKSSQSQIDLSDLEKGVYFIKIQSEQGISTKKIIKE